MKLTHTLLLALATASLALTSCSSEPSDWRPDDKVSLDMVAPGTRASETYDQHTEGHDQHTGHAPHQAKGAAIAEPINSGVDLDNRAKPSAKGAMSANAEEGMRKRGQLNDAGKSSQEAHSGTEEK